ncbi:MAG: FliM/FliN family flagellar motor switch protein [Myxococcales bacterium]|nr:FliM/FliN family flagellar motor switch protein [Myxococcales bacterium]
MDHGYDAAVDDLSPIPPPVRLGAQRHSFLPSRLERAWLATLGRLGGRWRLGPDGPVQSAGALALPRGAVLQLGVEGMPRTDLAGVARLVFGGPDARLRPPPPGGESPRVPWASVWTDGQRRVWLGADDAAHSELWAGANPSREAWWSRLGQVPLDVTVEVGRRMLPLAQVDQLAVGQIITFGPRDDGFRLKVGDVTAHRVQPVRRGPRLGCRVVDGDA